MKKNLALVALCVVPLLFFFLRSGDQTVSFHLDRVRGLQTGDAVYFHGLRVGTVEDLAIEGARVEVRIVIFERFASDIPAESTFLLWPDEIDPDRRSIRILPPPAPVPTVRMSTSEEVTVAAS